MIDTIFNSKGVLKSKHAKARALRYKARQKKKKKNR